MGYDYFYGAQSEQFSFYRIPKSLFTDMRFKHISAESKVLYGLLLDRMNLSASNGWFDEFGRVFIIFTIEDMMNLLGCADQKISKLLNELDKKAGLIERKRQGLGKPNLIYVKNFISLENNQEINEKEEVLNRENHDSAKQIVDKNCSAKSDVKSSVAIKSEGNSTNDKLGCFNPFQNRDFHDSGISKITIQDYPKSRCNNTDNINTDIINTDNHLIISTDGIRWDDPRTRIVIGDQIRHRIKLDDLKVKYPLDKEIIDEIFEIMVDAVCSNRKTLRVDSDNKTIEIVRKTLLNLDSNHIEYILESFENNKAKIKNIKSYILTALYNAPMTISTYYASCPNHDLAKLTGFE